MNTNIEVEGQNGNFRRGKPPKKGQIEICLPEVRFLSGLYGMCSSI